MSGKTMMGMMLAMVIMLVVTSFRDPIGEALDVVFKYIAFKDSPVLTLILAGIIMITISTVARSLLTDFVGMARNQQIQSDFNAEFRQARMENNLFKMKKLQEQQPRIMALSMEASTQQMKVMPITMLFVIPVYAWVYYFLKTGDTAAYFPGQTVIVNMPWGSLDVNSLLMGFFPSWIILYTLVSLPIGQIENRLIRLVLLRKRLRQLDLEAKRAEIE
ncbi:MAG: DUF106 domain-containing protein [Candidatus Methanomethylophilaceae archaeon]|nr:DUF106 domain-containing protein [Thermoplasmata archaeon]MBR3475758.1 DUF106 domain-containing protein [Candidatus Methanomethylophilaceae archaeon]MBR4180940.1 DUF106 domain-containing protein [Candidatus Methanomethylophilaceae archaeon]MBR6871672.1 DUF106 domain-containing protein [Candidatus Methanomethylophilaceae archaeon]